MKNFTKTFPQFLFYLLIINIVVIIAGCVIVSLADSRLRFVEIEILSVCFSVISLTTIMIFLRGQTRDAESQTLHTLVSVVSKFLLELLLALFWFVVFKKNSLEYVIVFFVLYLTLTLFSILFLLKTLKSKPL